MMELTKGELANQLPSLQQAQKNIYNEQNNIIELPKVKQQQEYMELPKVSIPPIAERTEAVKQKYNEYLQELPEPTRLNYDKQGFWDVTYKHLLIGFKNAKEQLKNLIFPEEGSKEYENIQEINRNLSGMIKEMKDAKTTDDFLVKTEQYKKYVKDVDKYIFGSSFIRFLKMTPEIMVYPIVGAGLFLARIGRGIDNVYRTMSGKQTMEDLKNQYASALEDPLGLAFEAMAFTGVLKAGKSFAKGKETKTPEKVGTEVEAKPPEKPLAEKIQEGETELQQIKQQIKPEIKPEEKIVAENVPEVKPEIKLEEKPVAEEQLEIPFEQKKIEPAGEVKLPEGEMPKIETPKELKPETQKIEGIEKPLKEIKPEAEQIKPSEINWEEVAKPDIEILNQLIEMPKETLKQTRSFAQNILDLIKQTAQMKKEGKVPADYYSKQVPEIIDNLWNKYDNLNKTTEAFLNNIKSINMPESIAKSVLEKINTIERAKEYISNGVKRIIDNRQDVNALYKANILDEPTRLKIRELNTKFYSDLFALNKINKNMQIEINNIKRIAEGVKNQYTPKLPEEELSTATDPIDKAMASNMLLETKDLAPEIRNVDIKPQTELGSNILNRLKKGVSLFGISKILKSSDLKSIVYDKLKSQYVPMATWNSIYEFTTKIGLGELAQILDLAERGVAKTAHWANTYIEKLTSYAQKKGIDLEQFFENFEAVNKKIGEGKYDWILQAVKEGKVIDIKKLQPDEYLAYRIKKFTEIFAKAIELPDTKQRLRYLPHIVLKEIIDKIKRDRLSLTSKELEILNMFTDRVYKTPHELPRTLNLPHLQNPFSALGVMSARVIMKVSREAQKTVYSAISSAITEMGERAKLLLNEAKEVESVLKDRIAKAKDSPELLNDLQKQWAEVSDRIARNPEYNVKGFEFLKQTFEQIQDLIDGKALSEDKIFMRLLTSSEPLTKAMTYLYLKFFAGKKLRAKDLKLDYKGNVVNIVGKVFEEGQWKEHKWTAEEVLGKRPASTVIMGLKTLTTISLIGSNLSTALINFLQRFNTYSIIPKGKILNTMANDVKAHFTILDIIFNKNSKYRKELRRAGIFDDVTRLYEGLEYSNEGLLKKVSDISMLLMRASEFYNRASTYFMSKYTAEGAAKKMIKVSKKQGIETNITPIELQLMAKDVSDFINFRYTPLHNEMVFQQAWGKIGLQLGSFSVKQMRMLLKMADNYKTNPYVEKYVRLLKSNGNPVKFFDKLNNEGRFAVAKWVLLNVGIYSAASILFDLNLFQLDPRRQIIPPFPPILVDRVILPMINGLAEINTERGIKNLWKATSSFIPNYVQLKRFVIAAQEGEPEKAIFSRGVLNETKLPQIAGE